MIEWLLNKCRGYVCIQITGDSIERFFNLINARGIHIWDIRKEEDKALFYICVADVRDLRTIIKKTKIRFCIRERYGLPFFLFSNRKRKMFFLGLLSGWFIVYIMSLYVWNISFEGNSRHTDDELMKFINELGINEGMKQADVEPEEIEKAIRNEFFDITWASVEVSGTMLRIHVRENSNYKAETDESTGDTFENETGDVLATRNATVVSIVTRTGTPLVKKGAQVKTGDTLIEGKYTLYGDDLAVITEHEVRADGDIVGRVIYEISETINRSYKKKIYTGNEYTVENIVYNNSEVELTLPWEVEKYEMYDTISTGNRLSIGEDFYLPVYMGKILYKEYTIEDDKYTDEELESLANEKIEYILKKLEKNTIQILDNNVKIEIDGEVCQISGQITVLEYIGAFGGTYE